MENQQGEIDQKSPTRNKRSLKVMTVGMTAALALSCSSAAELHPLLNGRPLAVTELDTVVLLLFSPGRHCQTCFRSFDVWETLRSENAISSPVYVVADGTHTTRALSIQFQQALKLNLPILFDDTGVIRKMYHLDSIALTVVLRGGQLLVTIPNEPAQDPQKQLELIRFWAAEYGL